MKKLRLRCYLDRRRKCNYSPVERKLCQEQFMICEEMKEHKGEFHELASNIKWRQKHRGYADESNIR